MKRLEEEFFEKKEVTGLPDIVPISGLILGKLHRLENELRTVLEHWGGRSSLGDSSSLDSEPRPLVAPSKS
eukprot:CAMPEP_0174269542 /NCGR_PEP_ID=MMETSP0439-20130205/41414_1 /TAXON_ID=0 /ORGANISM="Stereomyxa ramosa, Strain Chinc5" /LENGTH=70 /DNA_ID=CAMNT_0015358381 /DNA_START=416 /DNA_END=625 /DNA_ORIENTATION=+